MSGIPDWDTLQARRANTLPAIGHKGPPVFKSGNGQTKAVASLANRYEAVLTEMLAKSRAPFETRAPDERSLGCHMMLFNVLLQSQAFGPLNPLMWRIYKEIVKCTYALDRTVALPTSVIPADSELARMPYFRYAETVTSEYSSARQAADKALEKAADREQLRVQLDVVKADFDRSLTQLTSRNDESEAERRLLQEQLDDVRMELSALRGSYKTDMKEKDDEIGELTENLMMLEKQLFVITHAEDAGMQSMKENRLICKSGLAGGGGDDAESHILPDPEEAEKMQQQLLSLLDLQIRDLQAALPHVQDDEDSKKHVFKFFTNEVDILSQEVRNLGNTIENLTSDQDVTQDIATRMWLPHELGKEVAPDGELMQPSTAAEQRLARLAAQRASMQRSGKDGGFVFDPQSALWRRFMLFMKPGTVMMKSPNVLAIDKLQKFMVEVLWRYTNRGPLMNENTSVAHFLYECLLELYGHESAALVVLQNIFASIDKHAADNELLDLFSDILAEEISHTKWQYLLLIYAYFLPDAPVGSFGLQDLSEIIKMSFPEANDDEVHAMLRKYRESGLSGSTLHVFTFFIRMVRLGTDPRFKRNMMLMKVKDVQASGGLPIKAFVSLVIANCPTYPAELIEALYVQVQKQLRMDRLAYEMLIPVMAYIQAWVMVEQATKRRGGRTAWNSGSLELMV